MSSTVSEKCSRQLVRRIQSARKSDPIEVIVRVLDLEALGRIRKLSTSTPDAMVAAEHRHTQEQIENVVEFLQKLEKEGAPVRLVDTSWLTHSVLAIATPGIVKLLAQREDVESIDLNGEVATARS